ncbi:hypothetical protein GCM10011403_20870 [Pseudohongiella nitratireducens]|uniref:Insecticide toxin TcdB middle/N-terminal domain-containing protein n=1 Tax=Pseudohongiella nitratireducens TaxID=1768907 RepID=A0A916QLI9_9GAMM|nr:RHS repeat-associated core domain-containing protein [Pseudohongiella nitratireducens]GFZ77571.1 hypothetical protein GCM10011403_20870 [Pseudohongiella nitratireducens]
MNEYVLWARTSVRDAVSATGNGNNRIEYEYVVTASERIDIRLSEIRYAFDSSNVAQVKIRLNYTSREDPVRVFRAGYHIDNVHRVHEIYVETPNEMLRNYKLRYVHQDYPNSINQTARLKSITECRGQNCLSPTVFNWSGADSDPQFSTQWNSLVGFQNFPVEQPRSTPAPAEDVDLKTGDINNDGYTDLVTIERDNGSKLFFALSNGSTLVASPNTLSLTEEITNWLLYDYDRDGYLDILYAYTDSVSNDLDVAVLFNTPASGSREFSNSTVLLDDLPYTTTEFVSFIDYDANGLIDVVYDDKVHKLIEDPSEIHGPYKFNSTSGSTALSQINTVLATLYDDQNYQSAIPYQVNKYAGYSMIDAEFKTMNIGPDFNNDSLPDIWVPLLQEKCDSSGCEAPIISSHVALIQAFDGTYSVYDYIPVIDGNNQSECSIYDFNRDSLPDAYCNGGYAHLNTGTSFEHFFDNYEYPSGLPPRSLFDFNNDGYTDYIYKKPDSNEIRALAWEGDFYFGQPKGFKDQNNSFAVTSVSYSEPYGPQEIFMDINGDGNVDFVSLADGVKLAQPAESNGTALYNVITSIEDGLGKEVFVEYKPLHDANTYTVGNSAHSIDWGDPVLDYKSSRAVVSQVSEIAPRKDSSINAHVTDHEVGVSYHYESMLLQPADKGFLGFGVITKTDINTGVSTETEYFQEPPFTGRIKSTSIIAPGNSTPVSSTFFNYQEIASDTPVGTPPHRVVLSESHLIKRAALNSPSGSSITVGGITSEVSTEYENFNSYGQATLITKTTVGHNQTKIEELNRQYIHNTQSWILNQLQNLESTTTSTGATAVTRETSYTNDSVNGKLLSVVRQPNDSNLRNTTSYTYDSFGNITSIELSASGLASRESVFTYDAIGRYLVQETNELGHIVKTINNRDIYGNVTSLQDSNGVNTYQGYGTFGRAYFSGNDTGAQATLTRQFCSTNCPTGAVYYEKVISPGQSEQVRYYDNQSRLIRSSYKSFTGQDIYRDYEYDAAGRLHRESLPYKVGNSVYWISSNFDDMGRQISSTNGLGYTSKTSYSEALLSGGKSHLMMTATDAENQSKITVYDALGQLLLAEDALGGVVEYEYNSVGQLTKLISTGNASDSFNIQTTIQYDSLGRRTSLVDPDIGTWSYVYNAYDEMTSQTDSSGQSIAYTYDELGRIERRTDYLSDGITKEGDTYWVYDDAPNGVGRVSTLVDVISNYAEAYDYDQFSRLRHKYTTIDNEGYSEIVTYDQYGRVYQQVDPTFHGIQFEYNSYGYVAEIVEASNSGVMYQEFNSYNAFGNPTSSLLGNGLTAVNQYSMATGLLDSSRVTNNLSENLQDNQYTYNKIGNLTNRKRYVESSDETISEDFHYDELNRLTKSEVTGFQDKTYQYDAIGNLTFKSDVGSYQYGQNGAGPHAVTTAGSASYNYDDIGNMVSGDGRTTTYTTFQKPLSIGKSTHTTEFSYSPNRDWYKRTDTDSQSTKEVLKIGNVEFIEHSSADPEVKRYIGDFLLVSKKGAESWKEQYLHRNSLGSVDVVTNNVGLIEAEMSFDAFGERRNITTLQALSSSAYKQLNAITTHGYTGHEMADEVGVIHMRGRVYDPKLARFMSGDPIISDLSNSQRSNRYSYVMNSPLKYLDPTGFDQCQQGDDACQGGNVMGVITVTYNPSGGSSGTYNVYNDWYGGSYTPSSNSGSGSSTGEGLAPTTAAPSEGESQESTQAPAPTINEGTDPATKVDEPTNAPESREEIITAEMFEDTENDSLYESEMEEQLSEENVEQMFFEELEPYAKAQQQLNGDPTVPLGLEVGGQLFGGLVGATLSAGVVGDPVNGKVCSVVVACVQFGLGVYGGGGGIVNLSLSDIALESGVSDSVGVFANGGVGGLSAGGSMNIGEGFLGGARGFAGGGIGLSFGIQACSASLNCTGE